MDPDAYKTFDDFKAAILERWEQLEIPMIRKLIDTMPRRVQAVIDAKGWHTCW